MSKLYVAIMQPYFFPYIGYFQLINAVDKFIFYDDVNFIKNGWINRNRILVNKNASYLTVYLRDASPFKPINETGLIDNRAKLIKTITMAYKKAPYFDAVFPVIEACMKYDTDNISELAIKSIMEVSKYLDISTDFEISSIDYSGSKSKDRTERILDICKENDAGIYINASGGKELYAKETFINEGMELYFLEPEVIQYDQFGNNFEPWLSIIDVVMFNSVEEVQEMLSRYRLV